MGLISAISYSSTAATKLDIILTDLYSHLNSKLYRLIGLTIFGLMALLTTSVMAGERFDVQGRFGFDWIKPIQAKCKKMKANSTQTLNQCVFKDSGAFGLPLSYYACPLKGKGEVLVFKDKKQCQVAIETMRANEP